MQKSKLQPPDVSKYGKNYPLYLRHYDVYMARLTSEQSVTTASQGSPPGLGSELNVSVKRRPGKNKRRMVRAQRQGSEGDTVPLVGTLSSGGTNIELAGCVDATRGTGSIRVVDVVEESLIPNDAFRDWERAREIALSPLIDAKRVFLSVSHRARYTEWSKANPRPPEFFTWDWDRDCLVPAQYEMKPNIR